MFVAGSLALNDVDGITLAADILADLSHDDRLLSAEVKRRLTDNWSMRREGIANLSADARDPTCSGRRDGFVGVGLTCSS